MNINDASAILSTNFSFLESIGMDGRGLGSGDGNIGTAELKAALNSPSVPPQLKEAIWTFLNDKVAARGIDGAVEGGNPDELHLNKDDLDKGAAMGRTSFQQQYTPQHFSAPNPQPQFNFYFPPTPPPQFNFAPTPPPQFNFNPTPPPQFNFNPTPPPQFNFNPTPLQFTPPQSGPKMPTNINEASAILLKHFDYMESIGMDGKGKGSGDGNIGTEELKQIINSPSSAPELKAAAQMMLNDKVAARGVDGAVEGFNPDELHLNKDDLRKAASLA